MLLARPVGVGQIEPRAAHQHRRRTARETLLADLGGCARPASCRRPLTQGAPFRGDQAGVWFQVPTIDTRRWFDPSMFMTKICGLPSRFDTKAISEPSGEKAGEVSM